MPGLEEIVGSPMVQREARHLFGTQPWSAHSRSTHHYLALRNEAGETVRRILLIPPGGCTADDRELLSPHPEALDAKIELKGAVLPSKKGFSKIRRALEVIRTPGVPAGETIPEFPYLARTPRMESFFVDSNAPPRYVVEENGRGFYHNLINRSSHWIAVVLEKRLRAAPEPDFDEMLKRHPKNVKLMEAINIWGLAHNLNNLGTKYFEYPGFDAHAQRMLMRMPAGKVLPTLIAGLNARETGQHQPCAFYMLIWRFAHKAPLTVTRALEQAKRRHSAPSFYLDELLAKIKVQEGTFKANHLPPVWKPREEWIFSL
ncbi:MAG: hypothetical protein V1708_05745 [Candidatus Micrarchaeota archaeon]